MAMSDWVPFLDPDFVLLGRPDLQPVGRGGNDTGYCNPAYDACGSSRPTDDLEERQQIVLADAGMLLRRPAARSRPSTSNISNRQPRRLGGFIPGVGGCSGGRTSAPASKGVAAELPGAGVSPGPSGRWARSLKRDVDRDPHRTSEPVIVERLRASGLAPAEMPLARDLGRTYLQAVATSSAEGPAGDELGLDNSNLGPPGIRLGDLVPAATWSTPTSRASPVDKRTRAGPSRTRCRSSHWPRLRGRRSARFAGGDRGLAAAAPAARRGRTVSTLSSVFYAMPTAVARPDADSPLRRDAARLADISERVPELESRPSWAIVVDRVGTCSCRL